MDLLGEHRHYCCVVAADEDKPPAWLRSVAELLRRSGEDEGAPAATPVEPRGALASVRAIFDESLL